VVTGSQSEYGARRAAHDSEKFHGKGVARTIKNLAGSS